MAKQLYYRTHTRTSLFGSDDNSSDCKIISNYPTYIMYIPENITIKDVYNVGEVEFIQYVETTYTPISINPTTTSQISVSGGNISINVECDPELTWSASSTDSFIHFDTSTHNVSGTLDVSVDENSATSVRNFSITFTDSFGTSAEFTGSQEAAEEIPDIPDDPTPRTVLLITSNYSGPIDEEGGSFTIHVDCEDDATWTASSSSSFISFNPVTYTGPSDITVTVAQNLDTSPRAFTIFVTDSVNEEEEQMSGQQNEHVIPFDVTMINWVEGLIPLNGIQSQIQVECMPTQQWKIVLVEPSSGTDVYFSGSYTVDTFYTGPTTSNIGINVEKNNGDANRMVTFKFVDENGNTLKSIGRVQEHFTFEVEDSLADDIIMLPASGGPSPITLTVTTTDTALRWYATSVIANVIQEYQPSGNSEYGTGNGSVQFTYPNNGNTTSRTITVNFFEVGDDFHAIYSYSINQLGIDDDPGQQYGDAPLIIFDREKSISYAAGSEASFEITTDYNWTVTPEDDFACSIAQVSIIPNSGSGDAIVYIRVDTENTSEHTPREFFFTVALSNYYGDPPASPITIKLTQNAVHGSSSEGDIDDTP